MYRICIDSVEMDKTDKDTGGSKLFAMRNIPGSILEEEGGNVTISQRQKHDLDIIRDLSKNLLDLNKKLEDSNSQIKRIKEKAKNEEIAMNKIKEILEEDKDEMKNMKEIIEKEQQENKDMKEIIEKDKEEMETMNKTLENEKAAFIEYQNEVKKEKDELLTKLRDHVICPVCLLVPRTGKLPVCRNGHITCEKCKR